jgi:hypothetical protein
MPDRPNLCSHLTRDLTLCASQGNQTPLDLAAACGSVKMKHVLECQKDVYISLLATDLAKLPPMWPPEAFPGAVACRSLGRYFATYGADAVAPALKAHLENENFLYAALNSLNSQCALSRPENVDLRRQLLMNGSVDAVLSAMTTHVQNNEVQHAALTFLLRGCTPGSSTQFTALVWASFFGFGYNTAEFKSFKTLAEPVAAAARSFPSPHKVGALVNELRARNPYNFHIWIW